MKFENYFKKSIQVKMITLLIIVVFLFFSFTTIYSINDTSKKLRLEHIEFGNLIANTIASQSKQNLLSMNYPAIKLAIKEVGEMDNNIISISVLQDNKIVSKYSSNITSSKHTSRYSQLVVYESESIKKELGEVIIILSDDELHDFVVKEAINNLILNLISIIGIVLVIYFFLNHVIIKPIKILEKNAEKIGKGEFDTSFEINSKDEIGNLAMTFTKTSNNLKILLNNVKKNVNESTQKLSNVKKNSEEVNHIISKISESALDVNNGSEKLKDFTKENLQLFDQLNVSINQISEIAQKTSIETKKANSIGKEGAKNATDANEKLNSIYGYINRSENNVEKLGKKITEISKILKVISDISEETNLLALNAAIEAARAGDAGRGFAVVASSVKDLAKQTQDSAKEINELIKSIKSSSDETIEEMKQGNEEFNVSTKIISNSLQSFNTISHELSNISGSIDSINKATKNQIENSNKSRDSLNLVNSFILESSEKLNNVIGNITKVNVSMKNTNKSIELLIKDSEEINSSVNKFKLK